MNDFEKDLEIVLLLSDMSRQELTELPITELKEILKELDFLDSIPEGEVRDFYKVGKKKYKLTKRVEDINSGQFIDLMELVKDKEQINNRLHEIMAVLLLPVKKRRWWQIFGNSTPEKYLHTPFEHTALQLHDMGIVDALAISNFFFALSTRLLETSLHYSYQKNDQTLNNLLNKLKAKPNPTAKERKAMEEIQNFFNSTNGSTT